MATNQPSEQPSEQPPIHEKWLKVKDPRCKCDQCGERSHDTSVYRCLACKEQYCVPCWQSKQRDDDGQHLCKQITTASGAASGLTRLTEQALNQPTVHGSLLKVVTTNATCDRCRKKTPYTTLYRCEQQTCMQQYCAACWQSQSRDGEGKHLCNQPSTANIRVSRAGEIRQAMMEPVKANEKVAIPRLKRKRSIADFDGNEEHVEKEAEVTEAANPVTPETQASKKQRNDGILVPTKCEDNSQPGVRAEADLHDASRTQ